jgi:hypothetical protein
VNNFYFEDLEVNFREVIQLGFDFLSCKKYCELKATKTLPKHLIIIRVDVDFSLKKAIPMLEIFKKLEIRATFFIRLHAEEYNPFSLENYPIIRRMIAEGHEVGYHSEVIDLASQWNETPEKLMTRDIKILKLISGSEIEGSASHGGNTGMNNLDFWKGKKSIDFGLRYEAYDTGPLFGAFFDSVYVSDSNWHDWKSYRNGELILNCNLSYLDYAKLGERNIYLLIHPDTFTNRE